MQWPLFFFRNYRNMWTPFPSFPSDVRGPFRRVDVGCSRKLYWFHLWSGLQQRGAAFSSGGAREPFSPYFKNIQNSLAKRADERGGFFATEAILCPWKISCSRHGTIERSTLSQQSEILVWKSVSVWPSFLIRRLRRRAAKSESRTRVSWKD